MEQKFFSASALTLLGAMLAIWLPACGEQNRPSEPDVASDTSTTIHDGGNNMTDRAVLAGGCFWGMQDLIRELPGVVSTRVGYTGGDVPNATYSNHGTHAEAIEIEFDPSQTSYRTLLEFFFQIHDPTTLNRQGNDRGTSYRSAIFYTTDEQRAIALDTIEDVNASGIWPGKVVTEVAPATDFWEAEPEHQDYLERFPNGYTCHFVRPNWVLPVRDKAGK
jgi:peptide-methionine (S)-S-oxide reductase